MERMFDEELIAQARVKGGNIDRLVGGIERMQIIARAMWVITGGIVGLTLTVGWFVFETKDKLQSHEDKIIEHEKVFAVRDARLTALEEVRNGQVLLNQQISQQRITDAAAVQAQVNSNRDRIINLEDFRKVLEPKVSEMWWMKERGITNSSPLANPKASP